MLNIAGDPDFNNAAGKRLRVGLAPQGGTIKKLENAVMFASNRAGLTGIPSLPRIWVIGVLIPPIGPHDLLLFCYMTILRLIETGPLDAEILVCERNRKGDERK